MAGKNWKRTGYKTLDRLETNPKVDEVSMEGEDGIFIYLIGHICPGTEAHSVHGHSVTEVMQRFRDAVPCDCEDCKRGNIWAS